MSTTAHTHAGEALQSTDPTRTSTLRKNYAAKLRGRFDKLITAIRTGIIDRDIFGLRREALQPAPIDPPPPFRFETDDRKHQAFLAWLRRQLDRGVLNVIHRNNNVYIQNAYHAGLRHAERELQKEGVEIPGQDVETTFNLPVHQESVSLLYQRNYEALQGITDEVAKQISQTLADGFARGENPREIARALTHRIDAIGKTRATVLARTEVVNAHSTATLNRYEELGTETVTIRAEWTTAGDSRVCPICRALEGRTVTIQEARSETFTFTAGENQPPSLSGSYPLKPPAHPNCRCAFLPVVS